MWKLEDLLSIRYPRSFELQGVYSTVNGMTLDMYLMNMRNMLMEQLTESELIVVNRCADGVNLSLIHIYSSEQEKLHLSKSCSVMYGQERNLC